MTKVAIVGGGVSGLSLAYYLENELSTATIDLFESSSELGGKVGTTIEGGYAVEKGADAILIRPGSDIESLVTELGLKESSITPQQRSFAIQREQKLHEVPMGMLRPFPDNLSSLWNCSLFSTFGKIQGSIFPFIDYLLTHSDPDPSIAKSLRRRFGSEVSQFFYETVFGGIHSGNAESLSFAALYPQLVKSQLFKSNGASGAPAKFISFRNGTGELITQLQKALKATEIHTGCSVKSVISEDTRESLVFTDGEKRDYDVVVLATPAYAAAEVLSESSPELSKALSAIPHSSSAVVTMALNRNDIEQSPQGSGYLLAPSEQGIVTGCTYSSEKWSDRAPDDSLLLRVFFGRNGGASHHSDDELTELAIREVQQKLSFKGTPLFVKLSRWSNGLPQYEVGHLTRLKKIDDCLETSTFTGLYFTGTSYRGVGIPDCVRQSKELANKISKKIVFQNKPYREEEYGKPICA